LLNLHVKQAFKHHFNNAELTVTSRHNSMVDEVP